MKNYKKPMALMNEELSEGVYAASGSVSPEGPSGSGVSVFGIDVVYDDTWNKNIQFKVTLQNTGSEETSNWSISLSVVGNATSLTSYDSNFVAALKGSTVTINPGPYGSIPAGGKKEVQFMMSYTGNSITLK